MGVPPDFFQGSALKGGLMALKGGDPRQWEHDLTGGKEGLCRAFRGFPRSGVPNDKSPAIPLAV